MTLTVSTRSDAGFASTSSIRSFSVEVDPSGESAPDTQETLLAAYGACYVPALRVAADKHDLDDLGAVDIEITGELDDSDKLDSISFTVTTGSELDSDAAADVVRGANQLCKVHAALRDGLEATVTIDGHNID